MIIVTVKWQLSSCAPGSSPIASSFRVCTRNYAPHTMPTAVGQGEDQDINLIKGLLDGLFPEFTQVFKNPCE